MNLKVWTYANLEEIIPTRQQRSGLLYVCAQDMQCFLRKVYLHYASILGCTYRQAKKRIVHFKENKEFYKLRRYYFSGGKVHPKETIINTFELKVPNI